MAEPTGFRIKDSGERTQFDSGMQRDISTDKPRYDLIWQPGIKRLADHMGKGAKKYTAHNWLKANGQAELDRFKESAERHLQDWKEGKRDEDHMAAVIFNLFGAEMVRDKMDRAGIIYVWDYFAL